MTRRTWGRRERGGASVRGGRMGSRARLGWLGVTYVVEDGGVGVHGGGHGRGAAVGILQVEEGRSAVDGLEDLGGPVGRGDHGGGLAGHLREGRRVDGERDRSAMGDGGGSRAAPSRRGIRVHAKRRSVTGRRLAAGKKWRRPDARKRRIRDARDARRTPRHRVSVPSRVGVFDVGNWEGFTTRRTSPLAWMLASAP